MFNEFHIKIIKVRKPSNKDVNSDLQWFSESLGLFGDRDKEKSCFRVFIELLKASRQKKDLSSDEIAFRSHLSRATVVHHLNKLKMTGIVLSAQNRYFLRVDNLETLVEEIKKDINRIFLDLDSMAKEIDEELGLLKREKKDPKTIE